MKKKIKESLFVRLRAKLTENAQRIKAVETKSRSRAKAADAQLQATQRRLSDLTGTSRHMQARYRNVLRKIQAVNEDEYINRLCEVNLRGGAGPGTIQWAFCTRILDNQRITGVCRLCNINCYGKKNRPETWPCNVGQCPYETPDQQKPELSEEEMTRLGKGMDTRERLGEVVPE